MDELAALREEAAACRDLAREITDPASIAMLLDRAEQLEARARDLESEPKGGSRRADAPSIPRRGFRDPPELAFGSPSRIADRPKS